MPDFTIEYFWICESVRSWSTQVDTHTVTWGRRPDGPMEYDYACDDNCKGYKYRKSCRHVKEAKTRHCNWQQFVDGGNVVIDAHGISMCPRCGGPVTSERYAV